MAISKLRKWGARCFNAQWQADDRTLDAWIRDAFVPDKLSTVSPSAWERLRSSIVDRRAIRGYAMWTLDEPQHEPPENIPVTLSEREFHRAQQLHDDLRLGSASVRLRCAIWSTSLNPNFLMCVNW